MSEEVKTEDEPSIEEILDSIRQIISEDEEEEEAAPAEAEAEEVAAPEPAPEPVEEPAPEPEPEPEPVAEEEAEPLDQAAIDDMDFDAPVAEAAPEPEPATEDDVLELTDIVNAEENNLDVDMVEGDEEEEVEPVAEAEPEPEPAPPAPEPVEEPAPEPVPEAEPEPVEGDDSILTNTAEAAALTAISNLVRKTAIGHGGLTLEDIVRAELKPLLRVWLDKHLPIVIERLVKEELERVSKRVLDE